MDTDRARHAAALLRVALVLFVLAWLFGPYALRSAIPIWLPFLVALGLEVHFFVGGIREPPGRPGRSDRGPQAGDLERYGYPSEPDEMLLVRDGDEELWIPYSGETPEEVPALVAEARERAAREAAAPVAVSGAGDRVRSVRRLLVSVVVIAGAAAAVWFVDSRSGWGGLSDDRQAKAEALYSREGSRIAQHPVSIRCDDAGAHVGTVQHADGVATVGGTVAYLTPARCYDLYRLAFEDEVSFTPTARAIVVLAHESWHLRGIGDEGTTHCYALQSGVELAERLGVSEGEARRMMRQQFAENAVRGRSSPEYLVSEECRNGGRLDLHPGSAEFP